MSDARPQATDGRLVAAGLAVLLAATALVGWLIGGWLIGGEPSADGAGDESTGELTGAFEAHAPAAAATAMGESQTDGANAHERAPTVVRQKLPPSRDAGLSEVEDATGSPEDSGPMWADPINRRVLGQKQWMAKLPQDEARAIDEVFDASSPSSPSSKTPDNQLYPIDLEVRRQGVDLAKEIVRGCFDELRRRAPEAAGRVSVAFDLVADGRRGRFEGAEIPANVHLQVPSFEACILDGLERASFATSEVGRMRVEYPFLFDQR